MAAGLDALVVFQRLQRLAAEEPLVVARVPVVAYHHSAAGGVLNVSVQVVDHGGDRPEVGLPVGEQSPEVVHVQHRQVAAHVSPGDFGKAQRAVGHQLHRVGTGYAQLRVADNLKFQSAVGALLHVGHEVACLGLAGEQCTVDTGVLYLDNLPLGHQLRRIVEVGFFKEGIVVVRGINPLVPFQDVERNYALLSETKVRDGGWADQLGEVAHVDGPGPPASLAAACSSVSPEVVDGTTTAACDSCVAVGAVTASSGGAAVPHASITRISSPVRLIITSFSIETSLYSRLSLG